MPRIDELHQPGAVHMGIYLGRRDVGMTEQGLEHAKVGAAGEQVRRKGVTKNVRADSLGRNSGVSGHCANDLKKPNPA